MKMKTYSESGVGAGYRAESLLPPGEIFRRFLRYSSFEPYAI